MAHSIPPIDVRDMVCAQALAILSQAVTPVRAGQTIDVLLNTEDVHHDIAAWTQHQGITIEQVDRLENHDTRLTLRIS